MIVCAVDTSTMTASVAIVRGEPGGEPPAVLAREDGGVETHSDVLVPLIDRVLRAAGIAVADVEAFAVGAGPGSFTGLRIGMSTAKGLAYAVGAPLWAVSSLAALAQDAAGPAAAGALIVPTLDARRGEVFAGFYRVGDDGIVASIADERVLEPDALADAVRAVAGDEPCLLCGDGTEIYRDALASIGTIVPDARPTPSASAIARLALATPQTDVLAVGAPAYIRKSEAEIRFPRGNPGGTFSKSS
jgi:tRNA threonylcarbamoyladenosine biosynthesis protein TsaB